MIHCSLLNGESFGITNEMSGKMEGMWSLNTSANINPFCLKMRECAGVICKSCYTKGKEKMQVNCHTAWVNNYHVLSENVLKDRELPIINQQVFRFDAHGELVNRIHYKNLVKIADANPRTMFTLWTKHLAVVRDGHDAHLAHVGAGQRTDESQPMGQGLVFSHSEVRSQYVNAPGTSRRSEPRCSAQANTSIAMLDFFPPVG